jgi:Gamma-glutamyl cyclotransferase, AIG2-like
VLRDHRRGWGVAMDNRRTIPGYKFYVDPETGARPAVYVTFLCIWPEPGASVEGVIFEVDDDGLIALDRRERNYDRHDVSEHVEADGPVWAYLASAAGRERCAAGRAAGTAVVSAEYLARVPEAEPPELPVLPLLRRDVGA